MSRIVNFATVVVLSGGCNSDSLRRITPDIELCREDPNAPCGTTVALGQVDAGPDINLILTIRNNGRAELVIREIRLTAGDSVTILEAPTVVPPAEGAPLRLSLVATLGIHAASLAIHSNDPDTPNLEVEISYEAVPCNSGSTRSCGSDVGQCRTGTQTCADEVWSACVGSVEPTSELCNNADDDCDGDVDEDDPAAMCDDGVFCNGNESCFVGVCVTADLPGCADPLARPDLNGPCKVGACDEGTQSCVENLLANGTLCDDGLFCQAGETCQAGACTPTSTLDCSAFDDMCNDGVCDESTSRCQQMPKACVCDPAVDSDFDNSNQCDDCDDRNGSRFPGATETCNGIDDDCDMAIDEDFDGDLDTYSVCALRPEDRDCDDTRDTVHPDADEDCDDGLGGLTGNTLDDNCNGFIDEGCQPCDPNDTDGDMIPECGGDCAPNDGTRFPGNPEVCDGVDNDCNLFTVDNCGVGDTCNHDGDSSYDNDSDVCSDDLLCGCLLDRFGECSGSFQCTSYCNSSVTGALGDTCQDGETCTLDLTASSNVHGCDTAAVSVGSLPGGVECMDDVDCRSGQCERLFVGKGPKDYCYDYCGSDAYCDAANTVCRISRSSGLDGRCWPVGRPGLGTNVVGAACTADSNCDHGLCTTVGPDQLCTEACCQDGDCPSGFSCTLAGDATDTQFIIPATGPACTSTAQCPGEMVCYTAGGVCSWRITESAPMCVPDVPAQGTRRAGAACASNNECESNFCRSDRGVCLEVCCDDSTCPLGLTCELQSVETTPDHVTSARVCVNQPIDDVIWRR